MAYTGRGLLYGEDPSDSLWGLNRALDFSVLGLWGFGGVGFFGFWRFGFRSVGLSMVKASCSFVSVCSLCTVAAADMSRAQFA